MPARPGANRWATGHRARHCPKGPTGTGSEPGPATARNSSGLRWDRWRSGARPVAAAETYGPNLYSNRWGTTVYPDGLDLLATVDNARCRRWWQWVLAVKCWGTTTWRGPGPRQGPSAPRALAPVACLNFEGPHFHDHGKGPRERTTRGDHRRAPQEVTGGSPRRFPRGAAPRHSRRSGGEQRPPPPPSKRAVACNRNGGKAQNKRFVGSAGAQLFRISDCAPVF